MGAHQQLVPIQKLHDELRKELGLVLRPLVHVEAPVQRLQALASGSSAPVLFEQRHQLDHAHRAADGCAVCCLRRVFVRSVARVPPLCLPSQCARCANRDHFPHATPCISERNSRARELTHGAREGCA